MCSIRKCVDVPLSGPWLVHRYLDIGLMDSLHKISRLFQRALHDGVVCGH